MRLPLKVIIGALSGVIKTDSEGCTSERRKFEREIGQHKERRETREKPMRNKKKKIRPTGGGHEDWDGRRGVRLRRPHPSDAARFFKGDSQHRGYSHLKPPGQVNERKHATSARSFQNKSFEATHQRQN